MKKKILIRIGSLRHGGAEKVLVTLLKNLPEEKYEIDLLLNLYSGKYLQEVPSWINIYYLNKGEMITTNRLQDIPIKIYRKIYQGILKRFPQLLYTYILKGKKYDIEFAGIHGLSDEVLHSPNPNSKKLVWIHNDLSEVQGYTTQKIKKLFAFDKIMVISNKIEKLFLGLAENEEEKRKIQRIYNPINTQEILQKSTQQIDFNKPNVPVFVSIGTVFPQKGYDRLLRVHRKLLDEGFPHQIIIVGDGYDFENIKNLRNQLQLQETASMVGYQSNPYPYFRMADYYILSSRYEGFPTVLFEAITLQKDIIATDVSGVREMLQEDQLGLVVENSEEGIYKGMKKALLEPEYFNTYKNNIQEFNFPFSLQNSVQGIESILDEL